MSDESESHAAAEGQAPEAIQEPRERRRWPRLSGSATPAVGRARLVPRVSHHYPSLRPNGWYKMIDQNPDAILPLALDGYLWIEVDGRPRHVWAGHFEIAPNPPFRRSQ